MRHMPADPRAGPLPPTPFRPATPVVIGILGGIAAGKSAAAAAFAAHGLVRIDADAIGRELSRDPGVLAEVTRELGPAAVRDGQIDRRTVADLVFRDATARQRLEAILHPRIRARILADLAAAKAAGHSVLLDVPLLLENGLIEFCDHVVFLHASTATRQARAKGRGWHAEELARREAAQAPLAVKRARAGFVIDNDDDPAIMHRDVAAMLERLRSTTP